MNFSFFDILYTNFTMYQKISTLTLFSLTKRKVLPCESGLNYGKTIIYYRIPPSKILPWKPAPIKYLMHWMNAAISSISPNLFG